MSGTRNRKRKLFDCPSCGSPTPRFNKFEPGAVCKWCKWKRTALSATRIDGLPDRIASKIRVTEGCWFWIGTLNRRGYAVVNVDGRMPLAHRVIYEHLVGPIPEGHHLHHHETCPHNCVNPEHVTPKTPREHNRLHPNNFRSTWERMRARTHCSRGHEFTPENTRMKPNKERFIRVCRKCQREDGRLSQQARRARVKEKV